MTSTELRVATWNVNGLRSYILDQLPSGKFKGKTEIAGDSNLAELIRLYRPNIICFQETRCGADNMSRFQIPGWTIYSSSSQGQGGRGPNRYSGVSIWVSDELALAEPTKLEQLPSLTEPITSADREGRFLALRYPTFTIINTYVPNAGTNFSYRTERWDPAMAAFLASEKESGLLTIWMGDLNVARTPYDVHFGDIRHLPQAQKLIKESENATSTPEGDLDAKLDEIRQKVHSNSHMQGTGQNVPAGFTRQERDGIEKILESGYCDAWRHLHSNDYYQGFSWWNLRVPAYRPNDRGWRIDYVIIDNNHIDNLKDCQVLRQVGCLSHKDPKVKKYGSDHAPVCATIVSCL